MQSLYTYKTNLFFFAGSGKENEPDLILRYWVSPGSAPTSQDPGCATSVELYSAHVKLPDGSEIALPEWMFGALYSDEQLLDELLSDATDADEYARDEAADARREEMKLDRQS